MQTESRAHGAGLVVFGCLGAGLLLAIMLVVGPFAGATENVIGACFLLAFGSSWAALAVATTRLTRQPQRWALVPAALMALAGAMLLVWPEILTKGALGWLWPPVLAVLVAWMLVQSRRHLDSRPRRWVLYPIFAVIALSAAGGAYETIREQADSDSYPMPGQLVDVGDHRLHIHCTGSGSPTVVLEAGLGELSPMMAGWIQPDVSQDTRVCVYDRAGRGWSDPASGPQDGKAVAAELHTLLERAGERGPFVLAGHSAGGIYVLIFANLYPKDVAGVVLLDSMHPEQRARVEGWETFYQVFRRASALLPSLARIGVGRLTNMSAYATLPAAVRGEGRALSSTPVHYRSLRDEFSELPRSLKQAGELTSLGAVPLMVVTAEKGAQGGWETLQDELAALSSNSSHRSLPDATHESLTADKGAAAESGRAIRDVVQSVRLAGARQ